MCKTIVLVIFLSTTRIAMAAGLESEMDRRETIYYTLQQDAFIKTANAILTARQGRNRPTLALLDLKYNRPNLFDTRSFLVVNSANFLWISATDKYFLGNQVGSQFPMNEPTIFVTERREMPLVTGKVDPVASLKDFIERMIVSGALVVADSSDILTAKNTDADFRAHFQRFEVRIASQIIKLQDGSVCRFSNWISESDKYWNMLCLNNEGRLTRPAITAVQGAKKP